MKEIWERIENWMKENYPEGLEKLNKGASDELIQKTEKLLGIQFPIDIREFYQIHNGAESGFCLIYGFDFLSMQEIYDQWEVWKELIDAGEFDGIKCEPNEEIRDDWYHEKWIPITYNGCGDHHCLDLAPTEKGNVGQIIEMWHDDAERILLANSFTEWVKKFVEELEAGEYVYSEDYGGIVRFDD